jgi:hypothetical protein
MAQSALELVRRPHVDRRIGGGATEARHTSSLISMQRAVAWLLKLRSSLGRKATVASSARPA